MSNTSSTLHSTDSGFRQKTYRYLMFFTLSLSMTFCSAWAKEPMPALDWVKKMAQTGHNDNYNQTFIYENQSGITTIKMLHAYINGHEYEKILFLNGLDQEFIRKDQQIVSLKQPSKDEPISSPKSLPFSQASEQSLDQLQQLYRFKKIGHTRIAGRDCVEISVIPKDQFRYGYKLWIDTETNLMLRVDLLNENRVILDRFMVTHIQPNASLTLKDFTFKGSPWPEKTKTKLAPTKATEQMHFPWDISWTPDGFTVIDTSTTKSPINGENVQSILYSDGLSAFSVYVEKDTSRILSQSADKFGATSAVSRVFKAGKNAYYNVTVIGDLPLGAAERIAASIQTEDSRNMSGENTQR